MTSYINVSGQGFIFDTKNPSTYTITCGQITGGFWGVKNNNCTLFTPFLHPLSGPGDSVTINFKIRVGQTGNLQSDDSIHIYTQMTSNNNNIDNTWSLIHTWSGTVNNAVINFISSIRVAMTDSFRFIINMRNDYSQEGKPGWWQIFDSNGIIIDGVWYEKDPSLPIELQNFYATVEKNFVMLHWVTSSETNNNYFTIEKSLDSQHFDELAYVDGSGNSNSPNEYNYTDNELSLNAYYRLKQTDFNGKYSYSEIIQVKSKVENTTNVAITNYDNEIKVQVNSKESGHQLKVNIYNVKGLLISEDTRNIEKGINSFVFAPNIQSGSLYIVSACIENGLPVIGKFFLN